MDFKNYATHNVLLPKTKVKKDGDIEFALLMYLTQEKNYSNYKTLSVSVCEHDEENYLIVTVVDEITMVKD